MENQDNSRNRSVQPRCSRQPPRAGWQSPRQSRQGRQSPGSFKVRQLPTAARSERYSLNGQENRMGGAGVDVTAAVNGARRASKRGETCCPHLHSQSSPNSRAVSSNPLPPGDLSVSSHSDRKARQVDGFRALEQYREHVREDRVSGHGRTIITAGTRLLPGSADTELDIIDSYFSPSIDQVVRTHSRPTSLNSQYGYALANEEDYVLKEEAGHGDDEWDLCEVSSSED
ncbi:MAG: hypothetical protein Q9161_001945 [Pseudevernia consocians]